MSEEQEEYEIIEEDSEKEPVEIEEEEDEEDDEKSLKEDDDEGDDREAVREKRRQARKERKERQEAAKKRDKLELDFLRKQNDDLERRIAGIETKTTKNEMSAVEREYAAAVHDAQLAEKVIAKAVEAGNGEDVAQALRYRDQAIAKANHLKAMKEGANRPQPPKVNPYVQKYAQEFMDEHKWYDPKKNDEDSAIVFAIDQAVARDGFRPDSQEYWDELRNRVRRRLPDKFAAQPERQAKGGPKIGSGKEYAPASSRKEVYISAERKKALMDAGVWDDPTLRNKYIKRYMEYDKLNK